MTKSYHTYANKRVTNIMFILMLDLNYHTDNMQPGRNVHSRPDPPGVRFTLYTLYIYRPATQITFTAAIEAPILQLYEFKYHMNIKSSAS